MNERTYRKFRNHVLCLCFCVLLNVPGIAHAKYGDMKTCDFTCYVDRGVCFTGCETRKGIAASSEELIGYTAIVFTEEGEFIGYYEILDKIGTDWGRSGTLEEPHVIDIWCEDLEEAHEMMKLTGGKVHIQLVWAEG